MNLRWLLMIVSPILISAALAQETASPKHLYEVRPGMKEQTVLTGLGATHTVSKGELNGLTVWTVLGKGNFANTPSENGTISIQHCSPQSTIRSQLRRSPVVPSSNENESCCSSMTGFICHTSSFTVACRTPGGFASVSVVVDGSK